MLNNTSLILLFEVGKRFLLFPGDAQIENWSYALFTAKDKKVLAKLAKSDVYKVGHHGSLNATPKTLWGLFKNKWYKGKPGRLKTLLSSKTGKHGDSKRGTEVPRKKLMKALAAESELTSTMAMKSAADKKEEAAPTKKVKKNPLCEVIELDIT